MICRAIQTIAVLSAFCVFPACDTSAQTPTAAPTTQRKHEVVRGDGFAIAFPSGWRQTKNMTPTMPLYLGGDGKNVPIFDETGAPLQVGMTIEHWPNLRQSLEERRRIQTNAAAANIQLQIVGEPIVSSITLDDGTKAELMIFEFIKEKHRHSLQVKLLANSPDGSAWCASGFLVGGLTSNWPTANSALAEWLIKYVRSFCFEPGKLDENKLPGAFILPAAKP